MTHLAAEFEVLGLGQSLPEIGGGGRFVQVENKLVPWQWSLALAGSRFGNVVAQELIELLSLV